MRNDYIVRAQKFIQEIAYYLEGADSIESYDWAVTAFNADHHRAVKMAHGLTRIALITSDYVIKIDYDPVKIATFGGCKNEMKIYELAEHDNISYLFAKITPYEYNGTYSAVMSNIDCSPMLTTATLRSILMMKSHLFLRIPRRSLM